MDEITKEIAHITPLIERGKMHLNEYDALNHERNILNDTALQRKDFIFQVIFMLPQIIQNWCLCHYVSKYNLDNGLRELWGEELQTYMLNASSIKIKGDNSFESRVKAYTEAWEGKEVNKDPLVIDMIIITKFEKEKIPTNTEQYQETIASCIKEATKLIELLSKADVNDIKTYVLAL